MDPTRVKTALVGLFQQADQADLALLFSLRHDFPSEWSAFVNGADRFTATIRKDYFPYFTQGKTITITGLELYDGKDVTKPGAVGDPTKATDNLKVQAQFTLTAKPDAASAQIFLIVRYSF